MTLTKAVYFNLEGRAELREISLPDMSPTRVRVQTLVSGVSCGTEAHVLSGRADFISRPLITGYQSVAEVTEKGDEVTELQVGDKVLLCGGPLWRETALMGGTHAESSVWESRDLLKLPEGFEDFESASYAVLAGVALNGIRSFRSEGSALVGGLSMLGLMCGMWLANEGVEVHGLNRSAWKCEIAKKHGFSKTSAWSGEEMIDLGEGVTRLVDTSGNQELMDCLVRSADKDCELALLGYYPGRYQIDLDLYHQKNLVLRNPVGHGDTLPSVLETMAAGRFCLTDLITHRVSPLECPDFYADLVAAPSKYLGAIIDWAKK